MASTARLTSLVSALTLLLVGGCGQNGATGTANPTATASTPSNSQAPGGPAGAGSQSTPGGAPGRGAQPTPGGPPPLPGGGPGGAGGSQLKFMMNRIGKGPRSLSLVISNELTADAPKWESIQDLTKQYATLAGYLKVFPPPRGSDESWKEKTAAFDKTATELNEAAKAKNKEAALAAHQQLSQSCAACHREHRGGGPGGGPPGGPPGNPPGSPPDGPASEQPETPPNKSPDAAPGESTDTAQPTAPTTSETAR